MTRGHGLVFASACVLLACDAGSAAQESPKTIASNQPTTDAEPQSIGASLCTPGELVVFSCKIDGKEKQLSLCASQDVTRTSGYLYYVFGTPLRKELVFPARKEAPGQYFKSTHLMFAGSTGGHAYSFETPDWKYAVFSISGAYGLERQGVIATPIDGARDAAVAMDCERTSVIEDESEVVSALMRDLGPDEVLASRGLPARRASED